MKTFLVSICVICSTFQAQGQEGDSYRSVRKNVFKVNMAALPIRNVSIQYERAVGPRLSIAAGFRYMPISSLPLKRLLKTVIDDPVAERQLENFKVSSYAVTPELRFYL